MATLFSSTSRRGLRRLREVKEGGALSAWGKLLCYVGSGMLLLLDAAAVIRKGKKPLAEQVGGPSS